MSQSPRYYQNACNCNKNESISICIVYQIRSNEGEPCEKLFLCQETGQPITWNNVTLIITWGCCEMATSVQRDGYECATRWLRVCNEMATSVQRKLSNGSG